jgi:hypothetical protein
VTGLADPQAAARSILEAAGSRVAWVVLKMGAGGCFILTPTQLVHHPCMKIQLEDSVGSVSPLIELLFSIIIIWMIIIIITPTQLVHHPCMKIQLEDSVGSVSPLIELLLSMIIIWMIIIIVTWYDYYMDDNHYHYLV